MLVLGARGRGQEPSWGACCPGRGTAGVRDDVAPFEPAKRADCSVGERPAQCAEQHVEIRARRARSSSIARMTGRVASRDPVEGRACWVVLSYRAVAQNPIASAIATRPLVSAPALMTPPRTAIRVIRVVRGLFGRNVRIEGRKDGLRVAYFSGPITPASVW